jgi:hypothetical protein
MKRNGRSRYRLRPGVKIGKMVLVSTGTGWETGHHGTVLRIVKELAENWSVEFSGALLRPHSASLTKDNPKTGLVVDLWIDDEVMTDSCHPIKDYVPRDLIGEPWGPMLVVNM